MNTNKILNKSTVPVSAFISGSAIGLFMNGFDSVELAGVDVPLWAMQGVTSGASALIEDTIDDLVIQPFLPKQLSGSTAVAKPLASGVSNIVLSAGIRFLLGEPIYDLQTIAMDGISGAGSRVVADYAKQFVEPIFVPTTVISGASYTQNEERQDIVHSNDMLSGLPFLNYGGRR